MFVRGWAARLTGLTVKGRKRAGRGTKRGSGLLGKVAGYWGDACSRRAARWGAAAHSDTALSQSAAPSTGSAATLLGTCCSLGLTATSLQRWISSATKRCRAQRACNSGLLDHDQAARCLLRQPRPAASCSGGEGSAAKLPSTHGKVRQSTHGCSAPTWGTSTACSSAPPAPC